MVSAEFAHCARDGGGLSGVAPQGRRRLPQASSASRSPPSARDQGAMHATCPPSKPHKHHGAPGIARPRRRRSRARHDAHRRDDGRLVMASGRSQRAQVPPNSKKESGGWQRDVGVANRARRSRPANSSGCVAVTRPGRVGAGRPRGPRARPWSAAPRRRRGGLPRPGSPPAGPPRSCHRARSLPGDGSG